MGCDKLTDNLSSAVTKSDFLQDELDRYKVICERLAESLEIYHNTIEHLITAEDDKVAAAVLSDYKAIRE